MYKVRLVNWSVLQSSPKGLNMSNCVNLGMYFILPPGCVNALLMSISFIFWIDTSRACEPHGASAEASRSMRGDCVASFSNLPTGTMVGALPSSILPSGILPDGSMVLHYLRICVSTSL